MGSAQHFSLNPSLTSYSPKEMAMMNVLCEPSTGHGKTNRRVSVLPSKNLRVKPPMLTECETFCEATIPLYGSQF